MRYLQMAVDYEISCFKDKYGEILDYAELDISSSLIELMEDWRMRYQKIIMMTQKRRMENWELILSLDSEGLNLARKFLEQTKYTVKIEYFSEGQLKRLEHMRSYTLDL